MLAGLEEIAFQTQTEGLVLKAEEKATLPDQWLISQGVNMAQPS